MGDRVEAVAAALPVVRAALHGIEEVGLATDGRDFAGIHNILWAQTVALDDIARDLSDRRKPAAA